MLKKVLILINCLYLLYPSITYGRCEQSVKLLQRGEPAPCNGYLFSPEKNQELFIINEEHKLYKKEIEIKDLMINNLNNNIKLQDDISKKSKEQAELWEKRAKESTQQLFETQQSRGTRDFMFILLGVGLTVFAGWAVGQAN